MSHSSSTTTSQKGTVPSTQPTTPMESTPTENSSHESEAVHVPTRAPALPSVSQEHQSPYPTVRRIQVASVLAPSRFETPHFTGKNTTEFFRVYIKMYRRHSLTEEDTLENLPNYYNFSIRQQIKETNEY